MEKMETNYAVVFKSSNDEKEKYATFLFVIGEKGREIFNTWTWNKTKNDDGEIDDITVKELFERFEEYYLPKRNLVLEQRKFFLQKQDVNKSFHFFVTDFKNLAQTCEFENIQDGLILYKIIDGIKLNKVIYLEKKRI